MTPWNQKLALLEEENARLKKQLAEYQQLFNRTADPIIIKSNHGIIQECNQTFFDSYGYSPEEIIGKSIAIIHSDPDDFKRIQENIQTISSQIIPHEYLHKTKHGEEIPVEVCSRHITFNGEPAQLSTVRNITNRKLTEQALKESENRFRLAFESSGIAKSLSIITGSFFWVNSKMCDLFGYNSYEFKQMTSLDITHPEDLKISRDSIKKMMAGDCDNDTFNLTKRYLSKSGSIIWANTTVSLLKDEHQKPLYMIVEIEDITEQHIIRETNRELRNYLSNIIDSMPSIIIGMDNQGYITQWNKQAQEKTGLKLSEVKGCPLERAFPSLQKELTLIKDTLENGTPHVKTKIPRQFQNETVYEDLTIYPLIANGVEGVVIRIDDVSEKVKLEEMMIQSEKMFSIGGLAAGMAHEINNPLAGIIQNAQVILSRLTDKSIPANLSAASRAGTDFDTIQEYMKSRNILHHLELIKTTGTRAAQIVANMLSFARKSDSKKIPCQMSKLIDNTLNLAQNDYNLKNKYDFKKIIIKKEYHPDTPEIICEHSKIQQVVFNILKNAAHAMSEKPLPSMNPMLTIKVYPKGNHVVIEIKDTGPGIDPDIKKRIFEPFFTTKPTGKGTGLGLSISYFIIVDNHHGEMTVESTPGKGSNFIIKLPIKQ